MTLEQALEVLISRYNSGVIRSRTNDDEWRLATDTVIVALRGPQPDPDTGLMKCGCGEKAMLIGLQGFSYECICCGTATRNYEKEGQAKEAWNRAMGWREGNEN